MKKLLVLTVLVLLSLSSISQVTIIKEINIKGKLNDSLYYDLKRVFIDYETDKVLIESYIHFSDAKLGEIDRFNFVVNLDDELKNIIIDKLEAEIKKEYNLKNNEIKKIGVIPK